MTSTNVPVRPAAPPSAELARHRRPERQCHARQLDRRQRLAERRPADDGRRQRGQRAEEGDLGGGEPADAAEPEPVADGRVRQGEVEVAADRPAVERGRRALGQQGEGGDEQAARGQLPGGERQRAHALGAAPLLGQDRAGGHGRGGGERRQHAEPVEGARRLQHDQADPERGHDPGEQRTYGRPLTQQARREPDHEQRPDRPDDGGHTARQPVRREEQEGKEGADVQRAEHRRLPPPGAARQHPGEREQQQPGGQGTHQAGEQGAVGREELGGDGVGGAPGDGGEGGEQDGRGPFHGRVPSEQLAWQ